MAQIKYIKDLYEKWRPKFAGNLQPDRPQLPNGAEILISGDWDVECPAESGGRPEAAA